MRKIRVLHSELHERLGGIESFLMNVSTDIDLDNLHFDFLTTFDNPAFEKELEQIGANIYKVSSHKSVLKYIRDVRKVLDKGYDIVHVHKNSAIDIILIMLLKSYPDIKVIVHSHNTYPSVGGRLKVVHDLNRRYLFRNSDCHLACSENAGKWMYGSRPFEVIKNGIYTSKFKFNEDSRNKIRNEFHISQNDFVVLHVGRFTEQKNHEYVIAVFGELLHRNPNSKLLLVGAGELRGKISLLTKEMGIENSVLFCGVRNDVAEIMSSADAFLFPSKWEGLGIVAIESQAAGLDTYLSTEVPAVVEITDCVRWFDIKDDPKKIASIIRCNSPSEEERERRNLMVCSNGYDISFTARRLLEIYEGLI